MAGRPPGKSKRRGFGLTRTAGGQFGKRPAPPPPPPPPPADDPLVVQDDDEMQLDGIGDQEDKVGEEDDSSGSEHSNGTPEDVVCDGTTQGQTRRRKKASRGEEHQQGSRTPRCVDERSDDLESGGIVGGWHDDSGDDSVSSHDSDFELTNDEEDEEEDEEGPQGEEGPQPLGGARESLPPRASAAAAAAADHQTGATKGHHPWGTGTRQDKDDDMGQDGYERLQASTKGGSAREYRGTTNVKNDGPQKKSERLGWRPCVSGRRSTPRRALLFSSRSNYSNWTPSWSTRWKLYPPTARKGRRIGRRMPSSSSCLWS